MAAELEKRIAEAQAEAEGYQEQIRRNKELMADTTLAEYGRSVEALPRSAIRVRRVLKGHSNKIYSLHWSVDSRLLVSASQDGKLIVWDAQTTDKEYAITLKSSWVMTCAYSPSRQMVASGGLDNICSLYDLHEVEQAMETIRSGIPEIRPRCELIGHIGFISCCRFLSDAEVLTASGDTTCILWDVERSVPKTTFRGHTADVMNLALLADRQAPGNAATFVSVGCDATARIWDLRSGDCERIYVGHESDINAVDAFPDTLAFATGSDDCTCRLYDLRADREMLRFSDPNSASCVTSISFSRTGRGLFAAYDSTNIMLWDTIKAQCSGVLDAHEERVSSLGVSPDGYALASASWDGTLKIWA